MKKWILRICAALLSLGLLLAGSVYLLTFHPASVEPALLQCSAEAPDYNGQPLTVMTYNIQYLAGKSYVFYYDLADNAGPDERPSPQSIQTTLLGISALIKAHNPDVLLVQEFHDGAKATDYHNQLALLQQALGEQAYPCSAEAFYWKAGFVPHPRIMGAVGMKLGTLSRYRIANASRYQLPLIPADPVTQAFNLKRAVLLSTLAGDNPVSILNTHLDAFAQGSDTMQQQVNMLLGILRNEDSAARPWILGGDFNLLAPGFYAQLAASQQYLYNPETELSTLLNSYRSIPALIDMQNNPQNWFTHFPNDADVQGPDRTIDYLFYSKHWQTEGAKVIRTDNSTALSDHLPVSARFTLNLSAGG